MNLSKYELYLLLDLLKEKLQYLENNDKKQFMYYEDISNLKEVIEKEYLREK